MTIIIISIIILMYFKYEQFENNTQECFSKNKEYLKNQLADIRKRKHQAFI